MIPTKVFLTKGVGVHAKKLQSFELALRDADIERCNLVSVSSILPPHCKIISRAQGVQLLEPGAITFAVLARNSTNEPGRLLASAIGLAHISPKNPGKVVSHGYLSEHTSFGENQKTAGDYAEDLAATMLATTHGIEFDPDARWDERRKIYWMHDLKVASRSVVQTAVGARDGSWTTVVSAAVFSF